MSEATITSLPTSAISDTDRANAERFIAENEATPLAAALRQILNARNRGLTVDLITEDAEITPNQAADILKMSRPHLLKFMDHGDLPYRRVGTHRRIKMSDLREFMAKRDAGAEIVANALHGPKVPLVASAPLSPEEIAELRDL